LGPYLGAASITALPAIASPDRLAALRRLNVLDSPALRPLDRLTGLAAQLLEAPIALITLIDADRQFFLSSSGLPEPIKSDRQTALSYSVCQYAVASGRPLVVDDARVEAALADIPAVTEFGVAAYAGIPLFTAEGHAIGTLCVMDLRPRHWSGDQLATLAHLADVAMDEIALSAHRPRPNAATDASNPTTR
jgi:GAF domain-containing protein